MANRQDIKYATKANAQTLSSASPNMVQIENRLLKNTLQVLHMLSSTLSPFPLFTSLAIPSEIAISKQMESLGQMGGKQITEVRVRGDGVHLNKQSIAWISSGRSLVSQSIRRLRSSLSSGNCAFFKKCSHIYTMSASKMNVLLVSIPRLGSEEQ